MRRERFARLVKRVLTEARDRGLTIPEIEASSGVSKTTIYRWRDGDWSRDPSPAQVRAFFEALNVPVEIAHRMLDWAGPEVGKSDDHEQELPPEFRAILRKLRDPSVSESEKQFLRESIAMLASRGQQRGGAKKATG